VFVVRRELPVAKRLVVLSSAAPTRELGATLARSAGAELLIEEPPKDRIAAIDLLTRLGPSYLVIDRSSLASIGIGARELAEALKLEGLILAAGEARQGSAGR
jgi:hypothetical protein